jgi:streptomycin 6-kinase
VLLSPVTTGQNHVTHVTQQDLDTLAAILQQLQQADASWWHTLPAWAAGEGSGQQQGAAQQQLVMLLESASCNLQQLRGEVRAGP